jgi:hypothetical protein
LFDHLTTALDPEESKVLFLRIREALTIVYPFLGMTCCIPACYGMIGVIQRKGPEYASNRVLRAATVTEEDNAKGKELRRRIYSSAGNSDIFRLMEEYFADLCMSLPRCALVILIYSPSYVLDCGNLGLSDFQSERAGFR